MIRCRCRYNAEFKVFSYFYEDLVLSILSIGFYWIFILQGFKVYEDLYEELVLRLKENPCTPKAPDLPNPCQANTILYFCICICTPKAPDLPNPCQANTILYFFVCVFVFAFQKHQTRPDQTCVFAAFWFSDDSAEIMSNRIMHCTPKATDLPNPCQPFMDDSIHRNCE